MNSIKKQLYIFSLVIILLFSFVFPFQIKAQENTNLTEEQNSLLSVEESRILKARVLEAKEKESDNIPIFNLENKNQELKVIILEGEEKDRIVVFNNDFTPLHPGEIFYLNQTIRDGEEFFSMVEPYRLNIIYILLFIFIVLTVLIGGFQGLRGLISLALSFVLILYALLPGILAGYSPVLVSIIVSSFIIIVGSYITHGFNKTTTSAVFGMILTIILTGTLAYFSVQYGNFTGYDNEEAVFLNRNHQGEIDLVGILIGGIMIGLLGVLYDIAINQAIFVEELHHIAPHIKRKNIFKRAMRMGREHIGALVDTLAIAYAGASLPLLLLFANSNNIELILNREIFATEIVRILIGSISLILAVPITTFIATLLLMKKDESPINDEILKKEEESLKHYKHHH